LNRWLSKEEVQMANKYMKKCSTSLVTKEMQIKTTLRFHFVPVKMAIKKQTTIADENVGRKRTLSYFFFTVFGFTHMYIHYLGPTSHF
jgi:hypothetical protein